MVEAQYPDTQPAVLLPAGGVDPWDEFRVRSDAEMAGLLKRLRDGSVVVNDDHQISVQYPINLSAAGVDAARQALADFEARFRAGAIPDDMPEVTVQGNGLPVPIAQALKQSGLTSSTSEALRAIKSDTVSPRLQKEFFDLTRRPLETKQ